MFSFFLINKLITRKLRSPSFNVVVINAMHKYIFFQAIFKPAAPPVAAVGFIWNWWDLSKYSDFFVSEKEMLTAPYS